MQHINTIGYIKEIESALVMVKTLQERSQARCAEWANDNKYHPEYLAGKISAEKTEFEREAAAFNSTMLERAADIERTEKALSELPLDLNNLEFVNAVQIVKTVGNAMPHEQQKKIAEQFRGNYPAERILAQLYSDIGMTYVVEPTDFGKLCTALTTAIGGFASQSEKTAGAFRNIEKVLNEMLKYCQSNHVVDLGVSEQAFMEHVCAAAGMPVIK